MTHDEAQKIHELILKANPQATQEERKNYLSQALVTVRGLAAPDPMIIAHLTAALLISERVGEDLHYKAESEGGPCDAILVGMRDGHNEAHDLVIGLVKIVGEESGAAKLAGVGLSAQQRAAVLSSMVKALQSGCVAAAQDSLGKPYVLGYCAGRWEYYEQALADIKKTLHEALEREANSSSHAN